MNDDEDRLVLKNKGDQIIFTVGVVGINVRTKLVNGGGEMYVGKSIDFVRAYVDNSLKLPSVPSSLDHITP